jgi:hypothetical protein
MFTCAVLFHDDFYGFRVVSSHMDGWTPKGCGQERYSGDQPGASTRCAEAATSFPPAISAT